MNGDIILYKLRIRIVERRMMSNKAKLTIKREVRTFNDLSNGSYILLEKSKENIEGSYYTTMASIIFTAFTFEAFLNHIGNKKIKHWNEIESIRVLDKYKVLCKEFDIIPELGKRPYQTLKNLFVFRNSIAHGKSQILVAEHEVNPSESVRDYEIKTKWEEYCTEKNAERAREDVRSIMIELSEAADEAECIYIGGFTTSSMTY